MNDKNINQSQIIKNKTIAKDFIDDIIKSQNEQINLYIHEEEFNNIIINNKEGIKENNIKKDIEDNLKKNINIILMNIMRIQ